MALNANSSANAVLTTIPSVGTSIVWTKRLNWSGAQYQAYMAIKDATWELLTYAETAAGEIRLYDAIAREVTLETGSPGGWVAIALDWAATGVVTVRTLQSGGTIGDIVSESGGVGIAAKTNLYFWTDASAEQAEQCLLRNAKLFDIRLTDSQLMAELQSEAPVLSGNCVGHWPLDVVANWHVDQMATANLTPSGTPVYVDDAPAELSAGASYDLDLSTSGMTLAAGSLGMSPTRVLSLSQSDTTVDAGDADLSAAAQLSLQSSDTTLSAGDAELSTGRELSLQSSDVAVEAGTLGLDASRVLELGTGAVEVDAATLDAVITRALALSQSATELGAGNLTLTAPATGPINFVVGGNSLAVGNNGVTVSAQRIAARIAAAFPAATVVDVSVGGSTTLDSIANYETQIGASYDAGASRNIVVYWEVVNDAYYNYVGNTAADFEQNVADLAVLARADGFEFFAMTTLPVDDDVYLAQSPPRVNFTALLDSVSALMRANATAYDAIIDINSALSPTFAPGGTANPYYYDDTHLLDSGYEIVSDYVVAQLALLLGTTLSLETSGMTLAAGSLTLAYAAELALSTADTSLGAGSLGLQRAAELLLSGAALTAAAGDLAFAPTRRLALTQSDTVVDAGDLDASTGRQLALASTDVALGAPAWTLTRDASLVLSEASTALTAGSLGMAAARLLELSQSDQTLGAGALGMSPERLLELATSATALGAGTLSLDLAGSYTLSLDSASLAVSAGALGMSPSRLLTLAASDVTLAGGSMGLSPGRLLSLGTSDMGLGAGALTMLRSWLLTLQSAGVSLSAADVDLRSGVALVLQGAGLSVSAGDIDATINRLLALAQSDTALAAGSAGLSLGSVLELETAALGVDAGDIAAEITRRIIFAKSAVTAAAGALDFEYVPLVPPNLGEIRALVEWAGITGVIE